MSHSPEAWEVQDPGAGKAGVIPRPAVLFCAHMAFPSHTCTPALWGLFLQGHLSYGIRAPMFMSSFVPSHFYRGSNSTKSHSGVRASVYKFGGDTSIQSIPESLFLYYQQVPRNPQEISDTSSTAELGLDLGLSECQVRALPQGSTDLPTQKGLPSCLPCVTT